MRTHFLHLLVLATTFSVSLTSMGQEKPDAKRPVPSFEILNREQIALINELCGVLESVKDEKAAANGIRQINALAKRQRELEKRLSRLGNPSKEEEETILKKYREEMDRSVDRLGGELTRLMNEPRLQKVLDATMRLMMNPPDRLTPAARTAGPGQGNKSDP
jgi:hypothetical protein